MANEIQTNNAEVQLAVDAALQEQKKKKKKKRLIILGVILAVIIIIIAASGGSSGSNDDSNAQGNNGSVAAEQEETKGVIGKYVCTVKSAKVCKNWEGKDSVKITYEFTNNSKNAESFDFALKDDLYQDGVGLESSFISSDDDDWGIDVKIKPGTKKEVSKVYILRDKKTPIDVELSELISFSDDKLTYTVDLK
ncbi:MAG: DUF5067 domain-containing protein [Eubacterium sp.]|nr:DUF5067 domain-containing protein [Eubacterium sp.]